MLLAPVLYTQLFCIEQRQFHERSYCDNNKFADISVDISAD